MLSDNPAADALSNCASVKPCSRQHSIGIKVRTLPSCTTPCLSVAVMVNIHKQGVLKPEERVDLLRKACAGLPNVRVVRWDGLLADYMRRNGEKCLIRGVRGSVEYESETVNAQINRMLNPEVETLFMPAAEGMGCVSSSAVREIASFGGDISPYVPEPVAEEIRNLLSK